MSRFNWKTVFQMKPCCSDLKLDIYKVFQFTEGYFSLILTKSLVFRPKYFQHYFQRNVFNEQRSFLKIYLAFMGYSSLSRNKFLIVHGA